MQQILLDCLVRAHRESEFSRRPCKTACSLNDPMSERVKLLKSPLCRTLWEGSRCSSGCQHLDFPGEVVGHHGAKREDLVSPQTPAGERIEGGIRLGLPKDRLLGAASVMEQDHIFSRFGLVGHNDFVIEVQVPGLEQM